MAESLQACTADSNGYMNHLFGLLVSLGHAGDRGEKRVSGRKNGIEISRRVLFPLVLPRSVGR